MSKELADPASTRSAFGIVRGSVVGTAVIAIVTSLVDVCMPLAGSSAGDSGRPIQSTMMGNPNTVPVPAVATATGLGAGATTIGLFINAVVKFLTAALVMFIVVEGSVG